MPILTIDPTKTAKGWSRDYSSSNSKGVEAPLGYYSKSGQISFFRAAAIGQIAPGETFSALADPGGRVTALPLNGAVDSAGEAYVVLNNNRLIQFGTGDDTIDTNHDTAHGGGHTGLIHEDVLVYKNATDEYILYSFNDATDADVGRRAKSSGTFTDNFLSALATQVNGTTLTKGVPHVMKIGPDGKIYITNGQYIAQHDPSSTIVDYKALNLGFGFVATGLDVHKGYLVISGYLQTSFITSFSKGEARCWFWDTTGPFYQAVYDLKDNYCSGVFVNRTVYVFTSGRNNTTKVKALLGSEFETVFESAQIGSPPRQGSIDLYQDMIHWCGSGSANLNCVDGKAFHQRTAVTLDGSTSPNDCGMVKNLAQNVVYIGRDKGSSTYDVVKIDHAGYSINADFRDAIRSLPRGSRISKVVTYLSQWGTGAAFQLGLFKNYSSVSLGDGSGTVSGNDLINKKFTFATYGAVPSISWLVKAAVNVDAFLLFVRFNHSTSSSTAAIIRKIDIHWEPVEKA